MKTKIKKISFSVLSMLAVALLLMFGVLLSGCNSNNNSSTDSELSTITLSEAKETIQTALNNQDIITLFEKVEIVTTGIADNNGKLTQSSSGNIIIDNSNSNFILESLTEQSGSNAIQYTSDIKMYGNGEYIYYNYNNYVYSYPFTSLEDTTEIQATLMYVKYLFDDEAFNSIYKENVTKSSTTNGYSLTLNIGALEYELFLVEKMYGEEYAESYWEYLNTADPEMVSLMQTSSVQVTVEFDNSNNITGLTMLINSYGGYDDNYFPTTMTFTVKEYIGEITQPQWVTDYLEQL